MEKIVRTVYRQLYKKAVRVEKNIAMRSALSCSPQWAYDHHTGEWVAVEMAKQNGWSESRIFLDNLIRKLNHGREFFIPRPANSVDNNSSYNGGGGSSSSNISGSGTSENENIDTESGAGGEDKKIFERPPPILLHTLRQSFESTPFTVSQMNIAFAALKGLAYVTDIADKNENSGVTIPEAASVIPAPRLTVVDEVEEMHHISLTKGLSDVLRKVAGPQGLSRTSEHDVHVKEEEEEESGDDHETSCGNQKSKKALFETPKKAQLLLSHPQMHDFFRHTALVVLRATPTGSAAFVLNKPLENDEGMLMPVNATIRLNHVHPIFGKHLGNHTVMIGGPVSRGSFDSSALLLHRIPDIDGAIPLSRSLWVDGDYDMMQRKIEDGTADPKDIVVMCGFSAWGANQLAGEMRAGSWIVACGSTEDPAMDDFIFALSRHAGTSKAALSALESQRGRGAASTLGEETHRRNAEAWVWAYNTLGAPYADLALNQWSPLQDPLGI